MVHFFLKKGLPIEKFAYWVLMNNILSEMKNSL